jgi:selenocysteine lyase/cysteine desulfurase
LQERIGVEVTVIAADTDSRVAPLAFREALRPNTKLVVLIHASNVTGTLQPIAEVGEITRQAGALFLVDAAQSAGHVPIDVRNLPLDLLACPGHKGLLGPLGTGLLYIRPGVEEQLHSFRQGGTGSNSEDDRQPSSLPDKYESGNHNAPGLFGLEASLAYLQERGVAAIASHERQLTEQLLAGLVGVPGLQLYGRSVDFKSREAHDSLERHVGVVSVGIGGYEPQVLATILDENFGVETRAGLHCAPGAHQTIGTFAAGGTVRLSVGPFTTPAEIDAAVAALREIAAAA